MVVFFSLDLSQAFLNKETTDKAFQQYGKKDTFIMKNLANYYYLFYFISKSHEDTI